jgi:hypothetical protein
MAIGFDAAVDGGNNGGATSGLTFGHTCTGSDRLLLVGFYGDVTGGNDDISSVTYAGAGMTLVGKTTATLARFAYLYYLTGPASGANNVVITAGSTHYLIATAASYTGVNATGQPDASATNLAATTGITGTVTTIADNCWTMAAGFKNFTGVGISAGAGTTERAEGASFLYNAMYDSNAAKTPAGSSSLVVNSDDGLATMGIIVASFKPTEARRWILGTH